MSIVKYNAKDLPPYEETRSKVLNNMTILRDILNDPQINGLLYGGVVRDFFVSKTDAHDIDIWFTRSEKKDIFVDRLKAAGVQVKSTQFDIHKKMYPFTVSQINVKFPNGHLYFIDLVVSGGYPVNDFDVNDLVWDGSVKHYTGDQEKANQIMRAISQKRMTMKPGFLSEGQEDAHFIRINKFKNRGWTIIESR